MSRHENRRWMCHECESDATHSIQLLSGQCMHLCRDHRDELAKWYGRDYPKHNLDVRPVARRRGVCRECGCTDDHACIGGCGWIDRERTLCTSCVDPLTVETS